MKNEKGDGAISLSGVGLTDDDIYEAMKSIPGYIDITPGDFKELYCIAYRHATERFARSVLAKDIMTERVSTVAPDTSILEAAEFLSTNGITGVPVVDANRKVLGVVSEKDILSRLGLKEKVNFMGIVTRCLRQGGSLSLTLQDLTAREIMSSPAITILAGDTLLDIVKLLTENRINRLPVTDSEGCLIGIVARTDVVNATLRSGTCSWNTSGK